MIRDNNDYGWQVDETPDSFQILPNSSFTITYRLTPVTSGTENEATNVASFKHHAFEEYRGRLHLL
jgi:hypothetical protein